MALTIHPIKAFNDNYIWALVDAEKKSLWVVDPGDATPVIEFLEKNHLNLNGILITHHHADHCGGVSVLKEKYNSLVYGPMHSSIQATDVAVDGEKIFLPDFDLTLKVLSIPGHTLEHVAYYCASENFVFCGDTLFSAGCGRIFEGTFEQMYDSLKKLVNLPDETKIYCGHEYTLSNLMFAKHVEPDNENIDSYISYVQDCMKNNRPSLPSNMQLEKKVNPFLRADSQSIINNLNDHLTDPVQIFAELRRLKNDFKN